MARHVHNETPVIYEGDFKFESGRRAATEILDSGSFPTAVVVANDLMALGAMEEFSSGGLTRSRRHLHRRIR